MSVKNPSGLSSEVHFDIPNEVASDLPPSNGSFHTLLEHFERCPHLGHFLGKSILPERVVVCLVDLVSTCNAGWNFDSMLVSSLSDTCVDLGEHCVTLS